MMPLAGMNARARRRSAPEILDHSGWVWKLGNSALVKNGFKRRWFELQGHLLSYHESAGSIAQLSSPKGTLDLTNMAIVPMSNTIEAIDVAVFKYNKYGMEIGGPEGRVYKLACESEDDLNSWIRTFRRVLPNNVVAKSSDLKAKAVPQPRERLARDSMMQWCSGVTDGATDSDDEGAGAEAGGSETHLPTPIRWSEPGPPPVADESVPRCYLIVFHIAKKHNIGTLIRSACAFGVTEVILCGRKEMNTFGAQDPNLRFVHFPGLPAAKEYLAGMGVKVLGVEITPDSLPLQQLLPTLPQPGRDPLPGMPRLHHVAFLLGNEGTGLSSEHLQICDHCVYIPQYGRGTASLNVATSAGIVLHHFALWAGLQEQRSGPAR